MRLLDEVVELLAQAIPAEAIHAADQQRGIYGDYITAQYAVQQANDVFGVDGIYDIEILSDKQFEIAKPGQMFGDWTFVTDVKIHFEVEVEGGTRRFSRVGRGVGVAQAPYNSREECYEPVKPQQLDTAAKSALSDAIKNALMRTGRFLGAELYFDERSAQALGYEDFSSRITRESEKKIPLPDLVCDDGWGKEKKFAGMTIKEIYMDADGFSAMEWASRQVKPYGFTAKMAEYFKLMQVEGEKLAEKIKASTTQEKAEKKTVMMWFGKEKPADEITSGTGAWRALAANQPFVDMLTEKFNPDDKIPNFHAGHPRVYNHFKRHFHIDKGEELTWGMLQALYTFCTEGSQAAGFGWPEYYAGDRAPTESTLEAEKQIPVPNTPDADIEDMLEQDSTDPNIVIGYGNNKQKVPASVQKMIRTELGIDNPDDWLWKVIGEEPLGEWTTIHTDVLKKVIDILKKQGITDMVVIKIMWEAGIGQLT